MQEPFYIIEFLIGGCNHKLKLNDIVLSESEYGDQISRDIKINQWVKNGINHLTLEITPKEEGGKLFKDTVGQLQVQVYEASKLESEAQILTEKRTPEFPDENSEDAQESHSLQLTFTAKLPFEDPIFYSSQAFDPQEHSELIFQTFKRISDLHTAQTWEELLELEKIKIEDLALRYYEPVETIQQMNSSNFQSSVNDGYNLVGFDLEYLRLKLMAGARLATIEDTAGFPAIFYDHPDGTFDMYKYYVCFKGDEIIIIR